MQIEQIISNFEQESLQFLINLLIRGEANFEPLPIPINTIETFDNRTGLIGIAKNHIWRADPLNVIVILDIDKFDVPFR